MSLWKRLVSFVLVPAILFMFVTPIARSYSQSFTALADGYFIDVYTQRGGVGSGASSESFKVGEEVFLSAEVSHDGFSLQDQLVLFDFRGPVNPYGNYSGIVVGLTDATGVASRSFRIGAMGMEHWEDILLGTWRVVALTSVTIEGRDYTFSDNLAFECTWDLTVDLYTQKGGRGFGAPSDSFQAGEVIALYMKVTNKTEPMPNVYVEFRVFKGPDVTYYTARTEESGVATVIFRLPWIINATYWCDADAIVRIKEYAMGDYIPAFECLAGASIQGDVYRDGKVDIKDVASAATAFGSFPTHPNWNPNCDMNLDLKVDIRDLVIIARNFGKTTP